MADQIKISELTPGGKLETSDLLAIARKHEVEDRYDYSRSIQLNDLSDFIANTNIFKESVYNTTAQNIAFIASNSEVPLGSVLIYAGETIPGGYMECDGSEVLESNFSDLFTLLSEDNAPHGKSANGNPLVPDLRGNVVAGVGGGLFSPDKLGKSAGEKSVLLTGAQSGLQAHSHTQGLSGPNLSGNVESLSGGSAGGNYTNTGTVAARPASSAHNNVQPTCLLKYIIKAEKTLPDGEDSEGQAPVSPFTKHFLSTDIPIPERNSAGYSHNLGGTPSLVQISIKCKVANYGYEIGDEITITSDTNSGENQSITLWKNSSAVGISSVGHGITIVNRLEDTSSGEIVDIDASNWSFVIRAWA